MEFLVEKGLDGEIKRIAAERAVRCAVAFWGRGAARQFKHPKGLRIVCNLAQGATNPAVITDLQRRGANVRQHPKLHAKVYLGHTDAVVTSANASTNGLALKGREQAGWVEAGVLLKVTPLIEAWFDSIWRRSGAVTPRDLEKAKKLWAARQRVKPELPGFGDFDAEAETLPLVSWWWPRLRHGMDEAEVRKYFRDFDPAIKRRLDRGLWIDGPADREAIGDGTWILGWARKGRTGVGKDLGLRWSYVTPEIVKRAQWEQEDGKKKYHDVALTPPAGNWRPRPFNHGGGSEEYFRLLQVACRRRPARPGVDAGLRKVPAAVWLGSGRLAAKPIEAATGFPSELAYVNNRFLAARDLARASGSRPRVETPRPAQRLPGGRRHRGPVVLKAIRSFATCAPVGA